jgi:Isoleucyl-tRNA synthetase (EC 6.1.1.5)
MDYKTTIQLPKTGFSQKANLSQKEPEILIKWERMGIYKLIEHTRGEQGKYILHDGPPYANGHIHMGHALNKIIKDIINKAKFMAGYEINYIPGWDCHGLPIEHEVDKTLGAKKKGLSPLEVRKRCREYAEKFVQIQRDEFKRLGVFGDWENPYLTMSFDYQATIVREFGKFVEKDSIYRRKKPIQWCFTCRTALAEAEVEYKDHTSPSIYVKFSLTSDISEVLPVLKKEKNISVIIWTTTPWTIPGNLAICLHPDLAYVAVKTKGEVFIMAEGLLKRTMETLSVNDYEVLTTFSGTTLENLRCRHPFIERDSVLILGGHVTLDAGTGCVHTAPGHGQEDYDVGLTYGLDIYSPVDNEGKFTEDVEFFNGQNVFRANKAVVQKLKETGALLKEEEIVHSYPHCWRCKEPIIFRATEQWFVAMDKNGFRNKALDEVKRVTWIPYWGKDRIYGMVENRPDWCISRQRSWGIPIAIFYCTSCRHPLAKKDIIDKVADRFAQEGADAWFARSAEELIPPGITCPQCGHSTFEKEMDILDVWFDSGVSWAAVMEGREGIAIPVDLYLEGSDQHRGWFHSALLTGVMTRAKAPYKTVLTHGFVVDGAGKKMSKTLGNVIHPNDVINKFGAEVLRLWVAAEDYREDIRISPEIIQRLSEAYRRFRNTCRFLLGNLDGFNPDTDSVSYNELEEIDRWALHKLQHILSRVIDAYESFEFHKVYYTIHNFCVVDLSAFYLDVLKDRLYCEKTDSRLRRSAQTVLYEILIALTKLFAPVLPFTTEEIWGFLPPKKGGQGKSVHLSRFPSVNPKYIDVELADRWEQLLNIRGEVNQVLEDARRKRDIGSSLEAEVSISGRGKHFELLRDYEVFLPTLFIVSKVSLEEADVVQEDKELEVKVRNASGEKCERCWNYHHSVGKNPHHPTICERCLKVLAG